jgi:hypothetical protein
MLDRTTQEVIELCRRESDDLYYQLTLAAGDDWEEPTHSFLRGLDEMHPGPYLGAILSAIDLTRLTGSDVVTVLRAQQRQVSHHQAGVYEAMAQTAHCMDAETDHRTQSVNEFAPEEIGSALTLTRRMANRELEIALDLESRVPSVLGSLRSGLIDGRKASLIVTDTAHIDPDQARQVAAHILTSAPHQTTGQLAARIRRLCIESDPESAHARYQRSLAERKMITESNVEGTAALIISECAPEDVSAARNHINILARRLKTDQETRTIDQLRADVALQLLAGRVFGSVRNAGSVDIHVDLTTLAGLTETPAELDGYGPVISEIAKNVAAQQVHGKWTATVTDPETGEPLHVVALRRRPTAAQRRKIHALHPKCVFPGCRMPAANCDLDHRIDHARGGPTTVANHAPLCRRHHLTKHQGRWVYRKTDRTRVEWTSPLGHRYVTHKPP